jgi:hypothetical protein
LINVIDSKVKKRNLARYPHATRLIETIRPTHQDDGFKFIARRAVPGGIIRLATPRANLKNTQNNQRTDAYETVTDLLNINVDLFSHKVSDFNPNIAFQTVKLY